VGVEQVVARSGRADLLGHRLPAGGEGVGGRGRAGDRLGRLLGDPGVGVGCLWSSNHVGEWTMKRVGHPQPHEALVTASPPSASSDPRPFGSDGASGPRHPTRVWAADITFVAAGKACPCRPGGHGVERCRTRSPSSPVWPSCSWYRQCRSSSDRSRRATPIGCSAPHDIQNLAPELPRVAPRHPTSFSGRVHEDSSEATPPNRGRPRESRSPGGHLLPRPK
jgi:hypothetical protein